MLVELLFQAACVSLFLSSGQGRVYPARKKPASFAVERRRVGPHVCFPSSGSGCCPGWMLSPGSGKCTLPLCSFGCGGGSCIAPNLCMCPDGEQGITCPEPPGTCGEYGCDLSCNHGGCQEVARVCPIGFYMAEMANGIRCTDIDECRSAACEGTCVNTEGGFACECGAGQELSADRRSCRDMDECQATPCQHRCENSVGSYRCSCQPGYHLHGNRHSCVDVDECRQLGARRSCQHSCHNTPGSFRCSCHPGYRLSVDRVSCEGYPKSILAPSPILQSLQHPPTLVLLPPSSHLLPKGSPSPHLPVAAPGTQFPSSSPSLSPKPSPHAVGAPGTSIPPSPHCWHRGIPREPGAHWTEPECQTCTCQLGGVAPPARVSHSPPDLPIPGMAPPNSQRTAPDPHGSQGACMRGWPGPRVTSSPHPMGIAPSASAWPGMSPVSPRNAPQDPAPAPLRLTAAPALQKSAISGDEHTCMEPGSAWTGMTAPPASAREGRWNVPSPPALCWIVPSTSGTWVLGSAALPAGTLRPPLVASWMTTAWSFLLDRSGLRAIPADGSVSCQRTDCVETCPYPIRIPGQCCPDCSAGCTYMGRIFSNNETFPSALDPCLSCICLLGSVACSPLECAIVCSYPFHPEGRCCPVCEDCNYQGRKVENGQSFIPEGQPCTRCTCQLGEVRCEESLCPHSCSDIPVLPVGCCPSCPATDLRLPLQGSDLSPSSPPASSKSPSSSQSPVPEDPPPGMPHPHRHRLAQLLLPTTLPLGTSPGIWGASKPPPTTPSPSGYSSAPTAPPDLPCEARAPPDPTGSPEAQRSPGNEDASAVPLDSPKFQVPGVPGMP